MLRLVGYKEFMPWRTLVQAHQALGLKQRLDLGLSRPGARPAVSAAAAGRGPEQGPPNSKSNAVVSARPTVEAAPVDFRLDGAARRAGLSVMCGGMVETRLGMSAMAMVACALGDVDFIDLDTAFLLAEERFDGGYVEHGPELRITGGSGLDVRERTMTAT